MKKPPFFSFKFLEKLLGSRKIAPSTHTALVLFVAAWFMALQTMVVTAWLLAWILSLK